MERLVIASAGHPASGKSMLAKEYFEPLGFETVRGSKILEQWAAEEGRPLRKRQDYDAFNKESRQKRGDACLAQAMLAPENDRLYIDGLRNLGDYMRIKQAGGYVLGLECPREIRLFSHAWRDPSHRYPVCYVDFIDAEIDEFADPDPNGSQTEIVLHLADVLIDASLPKSHVIRQVDEFVSPRLSNAA